MHFRNLFIGGDQPRAPEATSDDPPLTAWFHAAARRGLIWPLPMAIVVILAAPYLPVSWQLKGVLWLSYGIVALSLDLVWGRAGIFSFGHNALFGVGAYAYAIAAIDLFPLTHETGSAVLIAIAASALFAALMGYVLFYGKIGDVYFAIVTLAITLVFYTVVSSMSGPQYHIGDAQLGGFNGIPSVPSIALGMPGNANNTEFTPSQLLGFAICLCAFLYGLVKFLITGRFGRMLSGIRENELRMELLGYDTQRLKLAVFIFSGALAGAGGALFAAWGTFVNPSLFSLSQAALIVIWVMVGGRGSLLGAFFGVMLVQWISDEADLVVSEQTPLILGVVLIATVLFAPRGIFPLLVRVSRKITERRSRTGGTAAHAVDVSVSGVCSVLMDANPSGDDHATGQAARGNLAARSIGKDFGGVSVLRDVSARFGGPGVHVVIGANGAGKSTFFGVLTGRHLASRGSIDLDGLDISASPTFMRARRGLGIKTQVPSLFAGLTVGENLALALHRSSGGHASPHTCSTLEVVGLQNKLHLAVSQLAHGEQQWLEIALVLAQNPSVILLDEPAAGMTAEERASMVRLIRQLAANHTVIVVEHDMHFVRALDAPILMLHQGAIFRHGSFDEVTADPVVIDAYLGRKHAAQH